MRVFIDVRTKEEFEEGSVEGALNVPLQEVSSFLASTDIAKDSEIILFCTSGGRSAQAEQLFRQAGFINVRNCINVSGAKCLCE